MVIGYLSKLLTIFCTFGCGICVLYTLMMGTLRFVYLYLGVTLLLSLFRSIIIIIIIQSSNEHNNCCLVGVDSKVTRYLHMSVSLGTDVMKCHRTFLNTSKAIIIWDVAISTDSSIIFNGLYHS